MPLHSGLAFGGALFFGSGLSESSCSSTVQYSDLVLCELGCRQNSRSLASFCSARFCSASAAKEEEEEEEEELEGEEEGAKSGLLFSGTTSMVTQRA